MCFGGDCNCHVSVMTYCTDQEKSMLWLTVLILSPNFTTKVMENSKPTALLERLFIDFKQPIPSSSRNCYLLTVVDQFSRFSFAFPCHDMDSKAVIKHHSSIFSILYIPSFVEADRGVYSHDIATSHTLHIILVATVMLSVTVV